MVLAQMQQLLARLYDVRCEYDVYEYLITDRRRLPPRQQQDALDEQVLISERDQELQVGVYIDDAVIARLHRANPMSSLTDENLADYCTAFEGVSHFNYLTWRASHALPVSLLELELQAEVDKYSAALYLWIEQHGEFPAALHERFFHRVRFAQGLDEESQRRYRTANRHAARFCRRLDERFLRTRRTRPEAWLAELRHLYRCGHAEKLRRTS